ncbi:MAG: D-alanyl-D-alanine carboxypeptidase [Clostridiales bacterium]|jgi:D-alanyl-D-alanine carboxypeptidase (penicillin-binding protein 5/6)|nr:D-alanyl-D-alanine carboxypeptidase [Clostridiales bacterium]
MKKYTAVIFLTILLTFLAGPVEAFASFDISSQKAILIDAQTGQVLYSKNAHTASYPASVTKIMTAVLALERGTLTDYVPISMRASYIEGSRIYLLEGEKVTLEQVLYGLMLESGNDAAIAIAEYIAGSVEEFAVMMNDKAVQLGAKNTHFTNPNGLHDKEHVTTAYDMALIAKHAMTLPKFREIVNTVRYIIPETNMQDTRYLYNGNRLIKNTSDNYEGANGIKTGYTTAAKNCFVGSAQRGGREYITVILNEPNNRALWSNTKALLDYAFEGFAQVPVVEAGEVVDSVESLGSKSEVKVVTEQGFHYNYPADGEKPGIQENIVMDTIKPTIHSGERVGYIEYSIGDEIVGTVRLIAQRDNGQSNILASGMLKGETGSSKTGLWGLLLVLPVSLLAFRFLAKNRRRRRSMYIRKRNIFNRK